MEFLTEYLDALSWWRLPFSALGSELTVFLAGAFSFMIILGLFTFIIQRL